ncbi:MAG: hypothetical protein LBR78_02250, partial [Holosporales bacterium]|nr:hypothetical protein [Holosporales bacterium]
RDARRGTLHQKADELYERIDELAEEVGARGSAGSVHERLGMLEDAIGMDAEDSEAEPGELQPLSRRGTLHEKAVTLIDGLEDVRGRIGSTTDGEESETVMGRLLRLEERLTTISSYTPAQFSILQVLEEARIRSPIRQPLLQLMGETCGTIDNAALPGALGTLNWVTLGNGALSWPTTTFVQVGRTYNPGQWTTVDRVIQSPGATVVDVSRINETDVPQITSHWAIHHPWPGQSHQRELICITLQGNWQVQDGNLQTTTGTDQCSLTLPMYDRVAKPSTGLYAWGSVESVSFRAIKVQWTS